MSLLSAFTNLLDQFIDELVMTFPELPDLRTIQTLVSLMRRANPRMVLGNFLAVAGRYHDKIFAEDESFFDNLENWRNDPYFQAEYGHDQESEIFQRLIVFKGVWSDLTPSNKEHIWTYFKQLLLIGAKANKDDMLQARANEIIATAMRQ